MLRVTDLNTRAILASIGDISLLKDIYFKIDELTKDQCGGYFTQIDTFDLSCTKTSDLAAFDYCRNVLVDSFEAIIPQTTEDLLGDQASTDDRERQENKIKELLIRFVAQTYKERHLSYNENNSIDLDLT